MYKALIKFILSLPKFNPHGLKLEDRGTKLTGRIGNYNLMSLLSKNDKLWSIQLLYSERFSSYEEYHYISHINFRFKPSIIKLLFTTNQLITKNQEKL